MAKKKAEPKEKKAKGPKQGTLAGMEDRALQALESKAEEYAEVRDERMQLTEREVELNDELLVLMKKYKKSEYHHGEVHCWVKSTDERVRVKIGELKATDHKKKSAGAEESETSEAEVESEEFEESESETENESIET